MNQTITDKSLNINTDNVVSIPLDKKNSCENFPWDLSLDNLESMASDLESYALFVQSDACSQSPQIQEQVFEAMLSKIDALQTTLSFIRISQTEHSSQSLALAVHQ
ncbi:hypothetical protein [Vibrio sp. TRT 17S01]|uniref:hypothetical protein n=1 Tax=Vibrio sp. TRT 17S01 TaxID=3418505 RepID=UPI003CF54B7A